ncbi:MAG: MarR family transcriptional regulator [Verrucomicrobiales bacterium]|jgi:DNA-binding MarR family transcriptional regulator|nr:MarR family transcriptional regulator [Verrucomicrobiales bacterium]
MEIEKSTLLLQKKDYELLAEFRYALRRFLRFSEQAAKKYNLAPQQYQALLAIEGFKGRNHVTVGELAEQLQVAHHTAVELVQRLEKIQLVRRQNLPGDQRKVWISLTNKGMELLEKLYLIHRREIRSVGPQISKLLREAAEKMPGE